MKLFDNFSNDSDFTEEEMKTLEIQYIEICARIRNSGQYSEDEAERLIERITRVGRYLYDPWKPHLMIKFYEVIDELLD